MDEVLEEARRAWADGDREAALERLRGESKPARVAQLARWEWERGRPAEAWALVTAPEAPRAAPLGIARAELEVWLGRLEDAAARADALASDDDRSVRCRATRVLGRVAAAQGDTDAALRRFDEALAQLRDVDGEPSEESATTHLDAAEILLERGGPVDVSAAASRLADARDLIDGGGLAALRPRLDLLLAWARASTGDEEGARLSLEALRESADRRVRAAAHTILAGLHRERGADFSAQRSWESALEVLEGLVTGLPPDLRDAFWRPRARARVLDRVAGRPPSGHGEVAARRVDPRLGRLLEILKRLASEHDIDRLLSRVVESAVELAGAERGFLLMAGEGGLAPRTVLDRAHQHEAGDDDPHVAFSRSIAETVLIDGEPVITTDARADQRFEEYVSVHRLLLKSVACVPIRGPSGPLGVLYLEHRMRAGRFDDDDLDLLMAFADQAAIALANARLLARLEQRGQELASANHELGEARERIERLLEDRTAELARTRRELDRAREALREAHDRHGIVGRSAGMRRVFAVVDRVRDAEVPVVIHGESGTGKELVARAIHFGGGRAQAPFVAINCAAIPEPLLESELFGHVRGAFTGADRDRAGVLVRASGGTLFLDEVGDMPARMQVDLLRVLQEKRVRPVGGSEEIAVDVRIIAASNKRLSDLVERGAFREDLFYRLNVVELTLPPLRDRAEDIPLLCDHFLLRFADREGEEPKRLTRKAVERLARHPLPGNVRQLEHLLLNAWVMCEGKVIDAVDLALGEGGETMAMPPRLAKALEQRDGNGSAGVVEPPDRPANVEEFKEKERDRILRALEQEGWNRVRAAKALGMARRTFYRRLKEYEILG
jgi:serine/threonine-protein kinase PknK